MIKMQFVIFPVYPAKLREVFSLLFNQETVILGRVQNRLLDPHDPFFSTFGSNGQRKGQEVLQEQVLDVVLSRSPETSG